LHPPSVSNLTFDRNFNHPIKGIPVSIKKIIIDEKYENEIESKVKLHAVIEKR